MANMDSALRQQQIVGTKRDVSDFITNLDVDKVKLTNRFGRMSVKAVKHEYLTDSNRPAHINKHPEIINFDTVKTRPRRWEYNYVQQFMDGINIGDIAQAVDKYVVTDEFAYQWVKVGKQLAADQELSIIKNEEAIPMQDNVAGQFGGIPYYLHRIENATVDANGLFTKANHGYLSGDALIVIDGSVEVAAAPTDALANKLYYIAPKDKDTFYIYEMAEQAETSMIYAADGSSSSDGRADGKILPSAGNVTFTRGNLIDATKTPTKGALSYDLLVDACEAIVRRGARPSIAVMSLRNKRNCSKMNQFALPVQQADQSKISRGLDIIESDFGNLQLIPHEMYEDDHIDLLDTQYWKLGYLIPFHTENLPRVGTYKERVITGVSTIQCTAIEANARIEGLNGDVLRDPVQVQQV